MLREFVESGIPVVEGSYEFGGIRGSFLKDSEKAHSNPDYDDKKHMVGNKVRLDCGTSICSKNLMCVRAEITSGIHERDDAPVSPVNVCAYAET